MRLIDAVALERIIQEQVGKCMIKVFNPSVNLILQDIRNAPTIEDKPVTWYTADENQPDSAGDDVLIVDHDGKYHVAYYCSKGNWIDTNTGNPIEVVKWRYLRRDNDETN